MVRFKGTPEWGCSPRSGPIVAENGGPVKAGRHEIFKTLTTCCRRPPVAGNPRDFDGYLC